MDEIDRCCMFHDHCYNDAEKFCGNILFFYVNQYRFICEEQHVVKCVAETNDRCENALCECDKAIVDCWVNAATSSLPFQHPLVECQNNIIFWGNIYNGYKLKIMLHCVLLVSCIVILLLAVVLK